MQNLVAKLVSHHCHNRTITKQGVPVLQPALEYIQILNLSMQVAVNLRS